MYDRGDVNSWSRVIKGNHELWSYTNNDNPTVYSHIGPALGRPLLTQGPFYNFDSDLHGYHKHAFSFSPTCLGIEKKIFFKFGLFLHILPKPCGTGGCKLINFTI